MSGARTLAHSICVTAILLSACDTRVGTPPSWRGTYLDKAVATNPNGGGPQVIQFGRMVAAQRAGRT